MLNAEQQQGVKQGLLQMLANEPEHLVRRSVAEVVSSIAKLALPAGQWPELLDCMLQLSQSQHAEHREAAIVVFTSLTDTLGEQMRPHFAQLQHIFVQGLQDAAPAVRLAALKVRDEAVGEELSLPQNSHQKTLILCITCPPLQSDIRTE
jgi:hypothetical protein